MGIRATQGKLIMDFPSNVSMGPNGYWLAFASTDGFGGALDLSNRIISREIDAWPLGFPGGYGHGPYGHGGYGHGYYGAGWGTGMWGTGPWGRGAFALRAVSGKKLDGRWQVQMVPYDEHDNPSPVADRIQAQIQLAGTPTPAGVPVGSWTGGILTLTFAGSDDDEG